MPSLRSGALNRQLCSFSFWQRRLWRTYQLLSMWHLGPTFSFQQAQCAQVFPLKLAPSCTLFAGLGSTNKSAISLPLFLLGNNAFDELARLGALPVSSAIPCSLSSLISHIHFCVFSDWRHTVSSKFFDTQVSSISTKELVLLHHARCFLSFLLQRTQPSIKLLFSRIGRIENPSCSAYGNPSQDTSHLILHCPATDSLRCLLFGNFLSLYDLWSKP